MPSSAIKTYYGSKGSYLKEHQSYFTPKQLKTDLDFIIKSLKLKKTDKILDIACGHGRHTIALKKLGYNVEGVDFSSYLVGKARQEVKKEKLKISFYCQDIHKMKMAKKYDKVFLFFSEFGLFNANNVLKNIHKILKNKGLFLLDIDNINRIKKYLKNHPHSLYCFDARINILKEKKYPTFATKYYEPSRLKKMFEKNGFRTLAVYGNYQRERMNDNSNRTIILAEKK